MLESLKTSNSLSELREPTSHGRAVRFVCFFYSLVRSDQILHTTLHWELQWLFKADREATDVRHLIKRAHMRPTSQRRRTSNEVRLKRHSRVNQSDFSLAHEAILRLSIPCNCGLYTASLNGKAFTNLAQRRTRPSAGIRHLNQHL